MATITEPRATRTVEYTDLRQIMRSGSIQARIIRKTGLTNIREVGDDFYFALPVRGMGIDATFAFKDKKCPPLSIVSRELTAQVAKRWKEYGLP